MKNNEIKTFGQHLKKGLQASISKLLISCSSCLVLLLFFFLILSLGITFILAKSGLYDISILSKKYFTIPYPSHITEPKVNFNILHKLALVTQNNKKITLTENELTTLLQENFNNLGNENEQFFNDYNYDILQISIIDDYIELFSHLTPVNPEVSKVDNIYITSLIKFKWDDKITLEINELKLGDILLPKIFQKYLENIFETNLNTTLDKTGVKKFIKEVYIKDNLIQVELK